MTTVLFWDIDGTLLTTARAGIIAWELATADVLGEQLDLKALNTAGLTDFEIAKQLIVRSGQPFRHTAVTRLMNCYESHLPGALKQRAGRVLPGVREILEYVAPRSEIASVLLTGNTAAGAEAKLKHYGLAAFFRIGAFAGDGPDRASIARVGLRRAKASLGRLSLDQVLVIGDTPHDIECGKAIGARTIAVATGTYSTRELEAFRPWWVLEHLPPPPAFCAKLGLTGEA